MPAKNCFTARECVLCPANTLLLVLIRGGWYLSIGPVILDSFFCATLLTTIQFASTDPQISHPVRFRFAGRG